MRAKEGAVMGGRWQIGMRMCSECVAVDANRIVFATTDEVLLEHGGSISKDCSHCI